MSGWVPIRYARQNLLLGPRGDAAALYRLESVSYPFLPVVEKQRWLRRMERLATVIASDFSLYRVARPWPVNRYLESALALGDRRNPRQADLVGLLASHRDQLAGHTSHLSETYLAVSLDHHAQPARVGSTWVRQLDRARRRLEDLAGVRAPAPIPRRHLLALAGLEQRIFGQLAAVVPLRRASSDELEWLLRRAAHRGLPDQPTATPGWTPDALIIEPADNPDRIVYEPLGHDLARLVNHPICEPASAPARLVIETEHGDSHQALLTVGALAEEAVFPGPVAELLHAPLDAVPFGVDAVLHAEWIGNRQALAQVRKRITDVEQVYRDQSASVRGPGFQQEEDRVLARDYEAVLESTAHPPMLKATISLAVGAADPGELERRVDLLVEQFGQIALHRPRGLQEQLWLDHLPRPDGGQVADYRAQMTVEQFGALMPTATLQLGSDPGLYLGRTTTGGGRPVLNDPTAPSKRSRTSAVLLAGTLGSGKTIAAQLIALHAARLGSRVVDFDPKPDHALHQIPGLDVEVLELTGAPEQRGILDPLRIGVADLREELACSYYLDLLRDPPASWEHQLQRAVRHTLTAGEHRSGAVIDQLRAAGSPVAGEVAEALKIVADFGLARLGFATRNQHAPTVSGAGEGSVTTIRTPGLTLPDPRASRETYTRAERVSVATLSLVAAYALHLVAGDRGRHKLIVLDEAWFLLASAQGRSLIERLVRLGRAFNATVLVATQRLEDLGELTDLVGTTLIFGQESDSEAQRALRLLGLDPDDHALIGRVRGYRRGQCLMRDLDGRVGELQIDPADPHLLAALDTTPTTRHDQ